MAHQHQVLSGPVEAVMDKANVSLHPLAHGFVARVHELHKTALLCLVGAVHQHIRLLAQPAQSIQRLFGRGGQALNGLRAKIDGIARARIERIRFHRGKSLELRKHLFRPVHSRRVCEATEERIGQANHLRRIGHEHDGIGREIIQQLRRLLGVKLAAGGDGGQIGKIHRLGRALRIQVETSDRVHLITEELDANPARRGGRQDIQDAAAMGELPRLLDHFHRFIAAFGQPVDQPFQPHRRARSQAQACLVQRFAVGHRLEQRHYGGQNDHASIFLVFPPRF